MSPQRKRILTFVALIWAVVFLAGAMGELFHIHWLRQATDFKQIFLR